jgi:hypothetical protein
MRFVTSPEMLRGKPSIDRTADVAARGLAAACALNLNGVFSMAFDLGQAASIVMLVTSLSLIIKCGKAAWSTPFALMVFAIVSYLALASIFFDPLQTVYEPEKFYQAYGVSILIIWAMAGYTASLEPWLRLDNFLRFLRNIFLVSAASVWASPILYKYYVNLPLSAEQRMGGFFANPNEAAIASVIAVALVLGLPFRSRLLQLPLLLMAVGAVTLTFSKTAMSCLVVILAWHLFQRVKGAMLFILPFVAVLAIAAIQDAEDILTMVVENPLIDLDQTQKNRILAVGDILGGGIDERTSTGRTHLWALVLERAWDRFPLGSGIGSAHNVIGGIVENDAWQGAHNSFIMMLGESGPLPAVLLVASMVTLFVAVMRSPLGRILTPCVFALVIDMIATHGALATRYHNLMLAVALGWAAHRGVATLRRAQPAPAVAVAQGFHARGAR